MANMFINAMTDLWNSAGTTYTAIKMNVTNAASSATSKLIDLQVGGTSKFSVDKNGAVVAASTISTTGALLPAVSDGAALGSTTFQWSDLYGASTFTLNIGNGNWVGTHSSGIFTVSTGDLRVTTAGTNAASAVTVGGTQTLTAKTLTSPVIATILTNAGATTLTLPTTPSTDTLVGKATTDTLTNKSLTSPTITGTPTATGATWASLGTVTTITINGGSIASTPISGSTGSFTTLAASGVATLSGGGTFTGTFAGGTYTGGAFNGTLGASTPSTASVTTLTASSTVLLSPASANVNMSPTGTGTVTIAPATAGTINNVAIGGSTRAAGAFTTLGANSTVTFSNGGSMTGTWTSLGTVTTVDINGGTIDGTTIGGTSAAAITGTTIVANTAVIGITAGQSTAAFQAIAGGNSFEWGHGNPDGYRSTLGAYATAGNPFLAFSAEWDTGNLFRTRGLKGSIMRSDLAGGFEWLTVATATGTGLTPTSIATLSTAGVFVAAAGQFTAIGGVTPGTGTFTTLTVNTNANPDANDGAGLGTVALGWSDLDLASGGLIRWNVAGVSDVTITHSSNALAFAGAASGYTFAEAVICNTTMTANTLVADTNINVGSAMVIAEGQITFPPAQNASANVNCLDDYEEGTWSPAVAFTGASTGVTYSSQTGHYTKIGNRVFFTVFIRLSAKGSSTGAMSISLPPFTILNTVSGITFQVGNYSNFTGLTGSLSASGSGGGSTCSIQQHGATGTANVTDAAVTATMGISVSGHYPVN